MLKYIDVIAKLSESVVVPEPKTYTVEDLRAAFRAGWYERNKSPGLKQKVRGSFGNAILAATGGGAYMERDYVPAQVKYHNSKWALSSFKKDLHAGPYTEADLRGAFRAGWKNRDAQAGLKRVRKGSKIAYERDNRTYNNGIWVASQFRKSLKA